MFTMKICIWISSIWKTTGVFVHVYPQHCQTKPGKSPMKFPKNPVDYEWCSTKTHVSGENTSWLWEIQHVFSMSFAFKNTQWSFGQALTTARWWRAACRAASWVRRTSSCAVAMMEDVGLPRQRVNVGPPSDVRWFLNPMNYSHRYHKHP